MSAQYFYVMTAKPTNGDAGRIEEGYYITKGKQVLLTDAAGVPVGEGREIEPRGALFTARLMLRDRLERRRSGPNHEPIRYDNRGWR